MAKLRVSVVEDQEEMRGLLVAQLIKSGFEVIAEFSNGREALEKLDRENTDVLISDNNMPGGDGYILMMKLRETGFKKPSFCWSSLSFTDEVQNAGFSGTFDKTEIRKMLTEIQNVGLTLRSA